MAHINTRIAATCLALMGALSLSAPVFAADAPAAAAATADSRSTAAGHTFTLADGFSFSSQGAMVQARAPEGDTTISIVDVEAKTAEEALAKGWALAHPDFKRTLRIATPRPARNGWEEQKVFDYETSPNERAVVQAVVRRAGTAWVAILMEGSEATFEKRGSPIGKMLTSLRPKGYQRESFAGRKPHPLDATRIAALKKFLADGAKALDVPGVGFSLIDGNRVVYEGGVGVRALGKPEPVDANTLFMAASNTKAMTTALLAHAVDAGKLDWEQPAVQAFPGFKLGDPEVTKQVKIKHLVCACTGLPRQDLEWLFGDGRAAATTTFDQLSLMKPTSQFGEVFQYSNLMVAAGGYIAAAALAPGQDVGVAYDRLMRDKLFAPLGMNSTTFDFARALAGNHAEPHGDDLSGKTRRASMDLNYTVVPARPAGAVWTSPHDFSRYVLMELGRGRTPEGQVLISEKNLLQRYQPQIMVGEDVHYGMGLMVDRHEGINVVYHGGDMIGFHSNMFWLPDYGIGGTILTNSDAGVLLRGPFLRKLLELVFDGKPEADERLRLAVQNRAAEAKKNRELLTLPVPKGALSLLQPNYVSPELGPIKVRQQGGKLNFAFEHWNSEMALRKAEDGTLSFVTIAPGIGGVEFVVGQPAAGAGKGTAPLILRDAQHEYQFTPACGSWKQDDKGLWSAAACGKN
ncbi:serine hydrolase domain-containing protein [Paucibacter sp. APW11]|uniref:Serine hydrolase domain-containing protein n=2 Tax=Roseateles aquae TaxID=3077235 RepID=A0ABU3PFG8_9BURK|nr:serine hydrolase domain-containing protein [Paucibacter sp. APW11]